MIPDWSEIANYISLSIGRKVIIRDSQSVGGGCINQSWKVTDQEGDTWFIKTNQPSLIDMFEAEKSGLEEIQKSESFITPTPLCTGQTSQCSFLVMEFLQLTSVFDASLAGRQLAKMHQHTQNSFGWKRDNTIGSTPQINSCECACEIRGRSTDENGWVIFWQKNRLEFQLNLAFKKGFPSGDYEAGMELSQLVGKFFTDYQPLASLLHGDLWGGNCGSDSSDQTKSPVIYDPAVYYGDRETDLAMTELFGGFGSRFMDSYHECLPIDRGYVARKKLYNLYHILNHFNIFGGGYGSQAARMMKELLSEVR